MFQIGDKVWFRGRFSQEFSLRGEIEDILRGRIKFGEVDCLGVRFENGNFSWAHGDQLKHREVDEACRK